MWRWILPLLLLAVPFMTAVHAASWTVHPDGSGDFATIQVAIYGCAAADTILLGDGVFSGYHNRDLSYCGKEIVIRSLSGHAEDCIIDCGGSPGEHHRGFSFSTGEGAAAVLERVRITHGAHEIGGAITFEGYTEPQIIDCIFDGNASYSMSLGGGALYFANGSTPLLRRCEISGNSGVQGGGVFCDAASSPVFYDCVFRENVVSVSGGGGYSSGTPLFDTCRFLTNRAAQKAGGLMVYGGACTLQRCILAYNEGALYGGGMVARGVGPHGVLECTFCANKATYGSGVRCEQEPDIEIDQTLIAFGVQGSGVSNSGSSLPTFTCCDIFGNEGGDWVGSIAGQYGVDGNIDKDPLLCSPILGDFNLQEGSPCAAGTAPNPQCGRIGAGEIGCGPMEAACCIGEQCLLLTFDDCAAAGGEWLPEFTSCDPNPCIPYVITVCPDGTGDYATLAEAIAAAQARDVIELTDGVFAGEGNRDLTLGACVLTLRSQSSNPDDCVIDCEGSAYAPHRAFTFLEDATGVDVEGITIAHGYASEGGAIQCLAGSAPQFTNCRLLDNETPTAGGAVHCLDASPEFTGCHFGDNCSMYDGGALYADAASVPRLTDCFLYGNASLLGQGGGLFLTGQGIAIDRSRFAGNLAAEGAAIAAVGAGLTIEQCTLHENHAGAGAGIWTSASEVIARNTIIAFSTHGEAVCCDGDYDVFAECCDFYGNQGGDWVGCVAWLGGQFGNICLDPLFCDPGTWNLALQGDSPCCPGGGAAGCGLIGACQPGCSPMASRVEEAAAGRIRLSSVQPTPFSSSVEIAYAIPVGLAGRPLSLEVYDVAGRRLRALAGGTCTPGVWIARWDGRDEGRRPVSSGVYFVRLTAGEQRTLRRMVCMR